MSKFFNIAGPCIPEEHYIVPVLERLPELPRLIATKQFFVIHAARQSGKTTLLKALARDLNAKGTHVALYCSLETVHTQLFGYLDRMGLTEGWLAVFDRGPAVSWETKLTWQTLVSEGKTVHVVGL